MGGFSLIHWLILGVVILLLFGGNRFSSMMGDVAKGLKSFKQGMTDEDGSTKVDEPRSITPQQGQLPPQAYTPPPQAYTPPPQAYSPPPQSSAAVSEPVVEKSPAAHPVHVEMAPDSPGGEPSPPRGVPPSEQAR